MTVTGIVGACVGGVDGTMLVISEVTSDDGGTVSPGMVEAGVAATTVSVGTPAVGQMVMVDGTAVMMAGLSDTLAAQMPVK